jgi:hypothetical protein
MTKIIGDQLIDYTGKRFYIPQNLENSSGPQPSSYEVETAVLS